MPRLSSGPYHHEADDGDNAFELTGTEGSECTIQTLYEGEPKCKCCKVWVAECPEDVRAAAEGQLETKEKALVVRMGKNHNDDGGKPLLLHSIVVQNSSLRKTLAEVFEGYDGITPALRKLVFKAPFEPFHHRWSRFAAVLERQKRDDPEAAAYTQLLYDVVDAELRERLGEIADLLDNKVITYGLLWALFKPGTIVMEEYGEQYRFYLVGHYVYDSLHSCFKVTGRFVDCDGARFGYAEECIYIRRFSGTRKIAELPLFPVEFHPSGEEAKADGIARGRRFVDLKGVCYVAHSGTMTCKASRTSHDSRERYTCGRIVVDPEGYAQTVVVMEDGHRQREISTPLIPLNASSLRPRIRVAEDVHIENPRPPHYPMIPGPPLIHSQPHSPAMAWADNSGDTLTEEQLLLCAPTVRGYSLKLKEWGVFDVADISPITFNDIAFPNLMLPPSYKDLILSFVEAHPGSSHNTSSSSTTTTTTDPDPDPSPHFDDLVEGKGLGVVLLLVGNPGTGKTLTAEAIADRVRRPLYVLSAGELGQQVADVEPRLRDALELAERWDAVLLFDECDVFLQERSGGGGAWDLARNEIVAVFLRLLEYYRGILFMTTNRAETIDRAFHSRVHLTLQYPDLDAAAKEHIWRHFTTQSGAGEGFSEEVYQQLAALPMNGRQIKNTVRIATLVAARNKVPLRVEHVRTALQAIQGLVDGGPAIGM